MKQPQRRYTKKSKKQYLDIRTTKSSEHYHHLRQTGLMENQRTVTVRRGADVPTQGKLLPKIERLQESHQRKNEKKMHEMWERDRRRQHHSTLPLR